MKKCLVILAILFANFLFSNSVFAFDNCNPNDPVVPCTYYDVDYDSFSTFYPYQGTYVYTTFFREQDVDFVEPFETFQQIHLLYTKMAAHFYVGYFQGLTAGWPNWYPPDGYLYLASEHSYSAQMVVSSNPVAGGGVASTDQEIECGVNSNNYCQYDYPIDSEVELTAYPNTGYAFAYWEWNDGANSSTNNPETFMMDGAMNVKAVLKPVLEFPLSGTLGNRTITEGFGDDWSFGQCPTGTDKLHSGIDISATATETVKAASAGEIKLIFEDSSQYQWGWCIVIEHDGSYTTTYWHLNDPRNTQIYEGATVTKGQDVGTIKNMSTNTHFHFGVRMQTYTSNNIPNAGALPQNDCGTPAYPAFPEFFIDPSTLTYE